jgi:hypothetical protein
MIASRSRQGTFRAPRPGPLDLHREMSPTRYRRFDGQVQPGGIDSEGSFAGCGPRPRSRGPRGAADLAWTQASPWRTPCRATPRPSEPPSAPRPGRSVCEPGSSSRPPGARARPARGMAWRPGRGGSGSPRRRTAVTRPDGRCHAPEGPGRADARFAPGGMRGSAPVRPGYCDRFGNQFSTRWSVPGGGPGNRPPVWSRTWRAGDRGPRGPR